MATSTTTDSGVSESYKKAFKSGTEVRAGTKKIASYGEPVAIAVFGILCIIGLIIFVPPWIKSAGSMVSETWQPGKVALAPAWIGVEQTLSLAARKQSKPIRVTGDRCIGWWGANPDGNAFIAEVRGVNDSTWYVWDNFQKLKAEGKIPYDSIGWIRFTANEGGAEVFYEFRLPNQCN